MSSRRAIGHNPTLRARRLALELMRRREAAGLTREDVARQLEWSTSTVFRIETGRTHPHPGNVKVLLDLYGVPASERDGLVQLAREARQPGWWTSFRDVLPSPLDVYIGLEAGAAYIRNFEPIVVPGLLQTEDYAREVIRKGPRELEHEDVERRVQMRLERQRILTQASRPRLWVVLDEAAIRRQVGGPKVMRDQLLHLIESTEQAKTTLQVVPFEAGAHAGTGPCVILEFPDPEDRAVVYLEAQAGDVYVEDPAEVERYAIAFDRLRAVALSPDDSVRLIERMAREAT